MIRRFFLVASASLLVVGGVMAADAPIPPAVMAALADPARPAADLAKDDTRKAAQVATFAEVKPGDKVADVLPGSGYFSRIFAKIVGPEGRVYGVVSATSKESDALGSDPAFPNIKILAQPWALFDPPEKLDVVFISQFFHDLYNPKYGSAGGGPEGVAKFNKAVFDALKPGGVYVVIDHSGRPGTGYSEMGTLHRIEESEVKKMVADAGFVLEAESDALRNPADTRAVAVFDPSIRGKTDQFMLRFRKPKR
jgi:predicted methyltransferase